MSRTKIIRDIDFCFKVNLIELEQPAFYFLLKWGPKWVKMLQIQHKLQKYSFLLCVFVEFFWWGPFCDFFLAPYRSVFMHHYSWAHLPAALASTGLLSQLFSPELSEDSYPDLHVENQLWPICFAILVFPQELGFSHRGCTGCQTIALLRDYHHKVDRVGCCWFYHYLYISSAWVRRSWSWGIIFRWLRCTVLDSSQPLQFLPGFQEGWDRSEKIVTPHTYQRRVWRVLWKPGACVSRVYEAVALAVLGKVWRVGRRLQSRAMTTTYTMSKLGSHLKELILDVCFRVLPGCGHRPSPCHHLERGWGMGWSEHHLQAGLSSILSGMWRH